MYLTSSFLGGLFDGTAMRQSLIRPAVSSVGGDSVDDDDDDDDEEDDDDSLDQSFGVFSLDENL